MKINLAPFLVFLPLGLLALGGETAQAATIQVNPGSLMVTVGGTGGFSFSFSNDNSGYAVFSQTLLSQQFGGYGVYTDFIGIQNDLVIVAPGATITQAFNPATKIGAGSYTFLSAATPGTTVGGTLSLYYDVFSVDPNAANFDSITDYVSSQQVSQAVTMVAVATPEPGALGMAAASLLLIAVARRGS